MVTLDRNDALQTAMMAARAPFGESVRRRLIIAIPAVNSTL
jgi:hypothetical protein